MNEAVSASPRRGRAAGLRFAGDDRLVRRATSGDTAAFAEIYRRYQRELGRYCQAILGSRELAEDALQNTIVSAIKALPGETREIALRPWLYRVAYNESISLLRQRRPVDELDPDLAAPAADPSVRAEEREGLRALLGDLEELPDRQRGALVMRELSDLSYGEIAATFGFSQGAARQAIYEARGALAEMAEGRDMECAAIRSEISANDKRVLRGRRLRSHLRECEGCREFEAAIAGRRAEFAQIAPLAPAAAAAILQSVLGSSTASGGGLAAIGGAGGAAGGAAAAKSAAAVVAIVAAGVGTADLTGVIDLNGGSAIPAKSAEGGASEGDSAAGAAGAGAHGQSASAGGSGASTEDAGDGGSPANPGKGNGKAKGQGNGHGKGQGNGQGQGNGVGSTGTPPGQAQTPPGQTQTPPGQAGPANAAAQNPNGTPPGLAQTPPGQAQTPPGQGGTPPGQANGVGSQGTAPGQASEEIPE